MKLVFLPEASDDINRLFEFLLTTDRPVSAQKAMMAIDEGINEGINLLLDNPEIGVQMEHAPNYRQLFVPFGKSAYVLRYRVDTLKNMLVIVRIWHGRETR